MSPRPLYVHMGNDEFGVELGEAFSKRPGSVKHSGLDRYGKEIQELFLIAGQASFL